MTLTTIQRAVQPIVVDTLDWHAYQFGSRLGIPPVPLCAVRWTAPGVGQSRGSRGQRPGNVFLTRGEFASQKCIQLQVADLFQCQPRSAKLPAARLAESAAPGSSTSKARVWIPLRRTTSFVYRLPSRSEATSPHLRIPRPPGARRVVPLHPVSRARRQPRVGVAHGPCGTIRPAPSSNRRFLDESAALTNEHTRIVPGSKTSPRRLVVTTTRCQPRSANIGQPRTEATRLTSKTAVNYLEKNDFQPWAGEVRLSSA